MPKPVIAILVFPETSASVIYGMYDLFLSAGRDWGVVTDGTPGPELLRPMLVARATDPLTVVNGIRVMPAATLADCDEQAIICIPEVFLPPSTPLAGHFRDEIDWLRKRYEQGAILAAGCSGAMLLAEAGLLDGCEATTHWAWCDVMGRRFPNVRVRPQRALVVSGEGQRLIMAGGGTSWMDLALYLIARTAGVDEAMRTARVNLIDWHDIGQQPFAQLARSRQVDDAEIARWQTWLAGNYDRRNPVHTMVEQSGLAERSFKRRFRSATGMSPLEYVHSLRLEEAKQLLEASDLPVEAIAHEVGYEDAAFFSRLFRRKVNLTPSQYRRRFGGLRLALQEAAGVSAQASQRVPRLADSPPGGESCGRHSRVSESQSIRLRGPYQKTRQQ